MNDFLPFIVIGLTAGSVYALAGTGLVLTYRTSGIFNFAHGAIAAAVGYVFYDLRDLQGLPWPVALVLCLFVVAPILGLLIEQLARRVSDAPVVLKVVVTVALLVALQQLIVIRYGASQIRIDSFLPEDKIRILGTNVGVDQLIVMGIAILGVVGLALLSGRTRMGRSMRALVDKPELLSLMGTNPNTVRRFAWVLGTIFAGLSGVLLGPMIGLEPTALTVLVVQAFGAAAIGLFRSYVGTYVGALALGVIGALTTKYIGAFPELAGLPPSIPFILLFVVLLLVPRRMLPTGTEVKPRLPGGLRLDKRVLIGIAVVGAALVVVIPDLVGSYLPLYTKMFPYAIILLSLALLMRTANMVSLAQLSFAAVGSVTAARLSAAAGLPWWLATLIGALVTIPIGALLAIPAIRRSGIYLALATFGFAIVMERLVLPSPIGYGASAGALPAPRPEFAAGDRGYFYLVAIITAVVFAAVAVLLRTRLGRLLRAMSDSPTALSTYGTSVNSLKVIVFCVAAFLAGLGGALSGPVTQLASAEDFAAMASLQLVVILSIVHGAELASALAASFAMVVFPSYLAEWFGDLAHEYFPLLIGIAAILAARQARSPDAPPGRLRRAWQARRSRAEVTATAAAVEREKESV